jgi:hypothetical protein
MITIVLCPVLLGITLIGFSVASGSLMMTFIILAAWAWVIVENRELYLVMIRMLVPVEIKVFKNKITK